MLAHQTNTPSFSLAVVVRAQFKPIKRGDDKDKYTPALKAKLDKVLDALNDLYDDQPLKTGVIAKQLNEKSHNVSRWLNMLFKEGLVDNARQGNKAGSKWAPKEL